MAAVDGDGGLSPKSSQEIQPLFVRLQQCAMKEFHYPNQVPFCDQRDGKKRYEIFGFNKTLPKKCLLSVRQIRRKNHLFLQSSAACMALAETKLCLFDVMRTKAV